MGFAEILGIAAGVVLTCLALLWLASLFLENSSIVDVFWGLGFLICSCIYFVLTPAGLPLRKGLINVLVSLWSLRLALYIYHRNRGQGEDQRYQRMRAQNGAAWWWQSFFKVFMLQGVLIVILSVPLLAAQLSSTPARLAALDFLGALVWLSGFFFEAVGDAQMARFKSHPGNRGKVMNTGLWRYSRHPNYFGEALTWWGYFLIAAASGAYWTILSPLLMTVLLVRVSGVRLLEKTLEEVKPGYRHYQATTNAFVPWFPRRASPR